MAHSHSLCKWCIKFQKIVCTKQINQLTATHEIMVRIRAIFGLYFVLCWNLSTANYYYALLNHLRIASTNRLKAVKAVVVFFVQIFFVHFVDVINTTTFVTFTMENTKLAINWIFVETLTRSTDFFQRKNWWIIFDYLNEAATTMPALYPISHHISHFALWVCEKSCKPVYFDIAMFKPTSVVLYTCVFITWTIFPTKKKNVDSTNSQTKNNARLLFSSSKYVHSFCVGAARSYHDICSLKLFKHTALYPSYPCIRNFRANP